MTNLEKWLHYTENLSSPQNYIEWGFRYLIGASLQRRVWIGSDEQECFANSYQILCGNPGVGKGLVIKPVTNILRHWRLKDAIKFNGHELTNEQKATIETIHQQDQQDAQVKEMQQANKQAALIEPLLIPVAADATTYEALVKAVSESYRRVNYTVVNPATQKVEVKIYGHSSMCFSLQELSSLLRKRTDDTVAYLLGLYDCPLDYIYDTKTQGKDRVRRGCLNLLAGTTPGFMQRIFNDSLIDEGFSSRAFFIYAAKNRKSQFWIPPLTQTQKEARADICEHIRKLAALYGQVKIDDETQKFLQEWWESYCASNMQMWANKAPQLIPYYARKNIHVMKVAMMIHFAESYDLYIPLVRFQEAIEILAKEEVNMHKALVLEADNKEAKVANKILGLLEHGRKTDAEILIDCYGIGNRDEINAALHFLRDTNQITCDSEEDKDIGKVVTYYGKANGE